MCVGLGISGGVDSMALAYLVFQLANIGYIRHEDVHAFVIDHALRPGSLAEANHVGEVLKGYGMSTTTLPQEDSRSWLTHITRLHHSRPPPHPPSIPPSALRNPQELTRNHRPRLPLPAPLPTMHPQPHRSPSCRPSHRRPSRNYHNENDQWNRLLRRLWYACCG